MFEATEILISNYNKKCDISTCKKKKATSFSNLIQLAINSWKGGRRMCHFLKPKVNAHELSPKKSYSSKIRHSSFFCGEQYGTVKKWRRNRRSRWKPPFPADFFLLFLAILDNFYLSEINFFFIKISLIFSLCNFFYYWHVWNIPTLPKKVSSENIREIFREKSFSQMIKKISN